MQKRILVINQYFPPDIASTGHIAEAVCEGLTAGGAHVTAIVGQPSYAGSTSDAPRRETRDTLTIRRVPMGRRRGRDSLTVRAVGYARFLYGAWSAASRASRLAPPHLVVTFHNPPLVGLLGALLARRIGVPFIYVIQDIHPDILERTGWLNLPRWLLGVWRLLSRMILQQAKLTITLSEAMKEYLVTTYDVPDKAVVAIPLWGQPDLEYLPTGVAAMRHARAALDLAVSPHDLLVLYAGNMGVMHPVEILLMAAAELRALPVTFLFVGDGTTRRKLERISRKLDLANVHFKPYQPLRQFELLVQAADLCAVVLQTGLEDLCVPSRSMTFMSAGRPILAIMNERSAQAQEITQTGAGWSTATVEGVVRVLENLVIRPEQLAEAGAAARSLYRNRYEREMLIRRYVNAILDADPGTSRAPTRAQRHSPPHVIEPEASN